MHLQYSRVEFYRCICSIPLWSSTESKISQYVYYRSICSTPLWSSTESKISQYVYYRSICSIPLWSSTESKISQYVSICTAPGWSSIQYQTTTKQLILVKLRYSSAQPSSISKLAEVYLVAKNRTILIIHENKLGLRCPQNTVTHDKG